MKSLLRFPLLLIAFVLWLTVPSVAQSLPDPASPPRLVNDFAGILSDAQRQALEQRLDAFDKETSTQIAVVTVDDLDGYAPAEYAQRLHDKWGIGRKGKDNGVLILVKPKTSSPGEAYISVGYGLEGVIPDITAGRILDNEMIPQFREGNMYGGIDQAATVLMQLTRGEFTAEKYNERTGGGSGIVLVIVLLLIAFLLTVGRRGGGKGNSGSRGGWFPPIILGGGGGHRGGGGFSGGGFGGFGGGLSGGGGAGRSW